MSKFKIGIGALVAGLLVAFGAFGLGASTLTVDASITAVRILDDSATSPDLVSDGVRLNDYSLAAQDEDFTDAGTCSDAPNAVSVSSSDTAIRRTTTAVSRGVWICVDLDTEQGNDGTDSADVTFDSDDVGKFTRAICSNQEDDSDWFEDPDDNCVSTEGLNTDELIVDCAEQPELPLCDSGTDGGILVFWECPVTAASTTITITAVDAESPATPSSRSFRVSCRGNAGGLTVTASPTTVEIIPAVSNTAHSLIQVTVTDSAGSPVLVPASTDVDFATSICAIEESNVDNEEELLNARGIIAALGTPNPASFFKWEWFANSFDASDSEGVDSTSTSDNSSVYDVNLGSSVVPVLRSMAAAILHCDPHAGIANSAPGSAQITVCIEVPDAADICRGVAVTVIGPPATITVAASPTSLRCGEKSTITVTVKDSIGQNVSDHTVVEMISNLGGTLAGTGAVAGFAGPVVPISSTVAGTFGGVATAFLLTSESHSGPYEVVATSGGTTPWNAGGLDGGSIDFNWDANTVDYWRAARTVMGGVFSTPPISAQVTVTCNIPAPTPAATVTAPRTGTGIVPPNTGDAGLASSSSSWTLFAIGGIAAFALAGLATLRFARR